MFDTINTEFTIKKTTHIEGFFSTDSIKRFTCNNYDEQKYPNAFRGAGAYQGNIHDYNVVYEGTPTNFKQDEKYVFSFWMADFKKDLYPRTTIEMTIMDSTGKNYQVEYSNPNKIFKRFEGEWVLLEQEFVCRNKKDKIKITLWSPELRQNDKLLVDELLIKPLSVDVYKSNGQEIYKNNRYYKKQ